MPTALDGSIVYTFDSSVGSGGSTTTVNRELSVTIHLKSTADDPFAFADSGSTFTYSESSTEDDPQTDSSRGLHLTSSGSGSGPFGPKGSIKAGYGDNNPEVDLVIHAPFSSTTSSTTLCNGLTNSSSDSGVTENVTCNTGGTDSLAGTIGPGNAMKIASGQVINFTCKEAPVTGTGGTTVTGTLTSS